MKFRIYFLILGLAFSLAGCATASYSVGKDFSSSDVQKIVKGETTSQELITLFGEPFTKTVISDEDEKWVYTYSRGVSEAQSYVITMKVKTTSESKTLDVLVRNGVVINFAYNEGSAPYSLQVE